MATIGQIRGAILEEVVLHLLKMVGYQIVRGPVDSIDSSDLTINSSGLEVQGRGTWHQIDALAEQHHAPAFTYPLRLLVEAKFYTTQTVGLNVIRNSVGVQKDISENYFTKLRSSQARSNIRFNYQSAVFSVSGYSNRAIDYAVAHQIFLIEYKNMPAISPVIDAIRNLDENSFTDLGKNSLSEVRELFREILSEQVFTERTRDYLTEEGGEMINTSLVNSLFEIGGSYFGMLQGRWPLHLLTIAPLPASAFRTDTVRCRLSGNHEGAWKFTPVNRQQGDNDWFELQFNLPVALAELVGRHWGEPVAVATTKSENFSYIALSGIIGEVWRNVRVQLDSSWLEEYLRGQRT